MPSKKRAIFLILIIAIAIFFRFWQLGSIPPGLYQDEAMNGSDAMSSLESGKFSVFYANNNGREGMIVWLDALAVKLLGAAPAALRLFTALAGVLAVWGLYFLTKELFGVPIALASSFFMAISFWAVNFSRIGFRANLMLPFLIWSFYFLFIGFKKSQIFQGRTLGFFIIAGILFGLGFYTYIAYRFAVILLAVFFILFLIKNRGAKNVWFGITLFAIAAFIVALPIGLYFLNNPGDFFGRSGQVAVWSANSPLKAVAISAASTLGMFNIVGDFNWRHNYARSPELFWPIGILFLLGIYLSAREFRFSEKFIFLWLLIFLLPNVLTTEGNPHALRALGAMPMAMIFAGIGLVWIQEKIQKYLNSKIEDLSLNHYRNQLIRIKKEIFILLMVLLLFIGFSEFNKYFVLWAPNIKTAEAFSQSQVKIADYLNNLPQNIVKYVIWPSSDRETSNGLPVSAQTVYFLTHDKTHINYLRADELYKIKSNTNNAVIVPIYFDADLLHNLINKLTNGKIEFIYLNTPILIIPKTL